LCGLRYPWLPWGGAPFLLEPGTPWRHNARMIEGRRVVVVTPAGRERYLRVLAPHVLADESVDEWHLWLNTANEPDLQFMAALANRYPRVRCVQPPVHKVPDGNNTIGQYFRTACEAGTVYVRLDDDICWLEPGFFSRLVKERLANPEPLLLYPLIINNSVCTFLLKALGRIIIKLPITSQCMDGYSWGSGEFAEALHRWFLGLLREGGLEQLRFATVNTAMARVSINCISWFGESLHPIRGELPEDWSEEEYLSVVLPLLLGRHNAISGAAIAAHFSFFTQRERLDSSNVLQEYAALAPAVAMP
jgi:hypothetical protein